MATSISPVATIWLNAPSRSHGQKDVVGHGTRSPLTAMTTTKKITENGKPNRKRMLVAPQVPSGPVSERCIALRATWPSAAMMVKGIQSEATENMGDRLAGRSRCRAQPARSTGAVHDCDALCRESDRQSCGQSLVSGGYISSATTMYCTSMSAARPHLSAKGLYTTP